MCVSGYSGTPLWKKLGYQNGVAALVEGAPDNYTEALQLPPEVEVRWLRRGGAGVGFVHLFTKTQKTLRAKLQTLRRQLHPAGTVWVSWPKKASGVATDLTEDVIREIALPLGFVDVKVCAVDEVWSGLKLVIRKELR